MDKTKKKNRLFSPFSSIIPKLSNNEKKTPFIGFQAYSCLGIPISFFLNNVYSNRRALLPKNIIKNKIEFKPGRFAYRFE